MGNAREYIKGTAFKGGKIIISLDSERVAKDALREERDRLRNHIPSIKHTNAKRQAIKKEKRLDYALGRMIFFGEDYITAINKTKKAVANNELK
jgi:hypothetical protein